VLEFIDHFLKFGSALGDQPFEFLFASFENLLRLPLFGKVAEHKHDTEERPIGLADRSGACACGDFRAIPGQEQPMIGATGKHLMTITTPAPPQGDDDITMIGAG